MESNPFKVAKNDLTRLGPQQQHVFLGDVGSLVYMDEKAAGAITPARIFREQLKREGKDDTFTFFANRQASILKSVRMRQRIRSIRVKKDDIEKYQIRWPRNLGHDIIEMATTASNDTPIHFPLTSHIMNIMLQTRIAPADRPDYRRNIGMTPELTTWATELPPAVLNIPQPFGYSQAPCKGLKLGMYGTNNDASKITHVYTLRNQIAELIQMRRKDSDGEWAFCEPKEIAEHIVYDKPTPEFLDAPELWGEYSTVFDAESHDWQTNIRTKPYECFFNELVEVGKPARNGSELSISIKGPYTIRGIYWMAENEDATRGHVFSNYTTSLDEIDHGRDPITWSSLVRDTEKEWSKLPSDHHNDGLDVREGIYHPDEPGYHANLWCYDLRPGITNNIDCHYTETTLVVHLPSSEHKLHVFVDTLRTHVYRPTILEVVDVPMEMPPPDESQPEHLLPPN